MELTGYNNTMINLWLDSFEKAWISKDINKVLNLFDTNVEYWETPFKLLPNYDAIRDEWTVIRHQENIKLQFNIFANTKENHAIQWKLSYSVGGKEQIWAGTYLIKLGPNGKCIYFHQTGEKQ